MSIIHISHSLWNTEILWYRNIMEKIHNMESTFKWRTCTWHYFRHFVKHTLYFWHFDISLMCVETNTAPVQCIMILKMRNIYIYVSKYMNRRARSHFIFYKMHSTTDKNLAFFLLSSIYIKRKYWIRENFWHPVFGGTG